MKENNLIVVEQLPIIKEHLESLSKEIDKKVDTANKLVCNEDTVKEVKKLRTDLTKQFNELEDQRKAVKNAVLKPYNDFEEIYKECVSNKFKSADTVLKTKIDSVENELKAQKEAEVRALFEEYKTSLNIDFVTFENMGLKIGLSDSMKSLKTKATEWLDKINDDLKLIETQEHKEEILVEYKGSLNVSQAIVNVNARFKAIEEEKARQEQLRLAKEEEAKRVEAVNQIIVEEIPVETQAPVIEEIPVAEPKYTMSFRVTGTKEQLKAVKEFIIEMGLEYGN